MSPQFCPLTSSTNLFDVCRVERSNNQDHATNGVETCPVPALVQRAEIIASIVSDIRSCESQEHYSSLTTLSARLQEAAGRIGERVEGLEGQRAEDIRQQASKFLSQAEEARTRIRKNNQLKSIELFRKTLTLIFNGPTNSILDSTWDISRKKQTRKRCEAIRGLNPDGVISWAAAMAPYIWAGSMHNHIFEHLLGEIEPTNVQSWPSKIQEVLDAFGHEGVLANSEEYQTFLTGESHESMGFQVLIIYQILSFNQVQRLFQCDRGSEDVLMTTRPIQGLLLRKLIIASPKR